MKKETKTGSNAMKDIAVEKIVLNIGTKPDPELVKKARALLNQISGVKAVEAFTKKRIPGWGVRPGLALGTKVTLRGEKARELLTRLLEAVGFKLKERQFTENGFSFGIKEYIDIKGVKYSPETGMIGLDVCVTLKRPGFRVKLRRLKANKVGKGQRITPQDAIKFATEKLNIKVGE